MQKNVKLFPRKPTLTKLKRVAAYARVSTDKDAMLHSLSAQVSAYSAMIQQHPGWQYAGVYSDEALTGTKDNRAAFQRLLSDCRAGLIDMVITKSISRFARNTVHTLETVRELKALGVDVFFEEEDIHSLSDKGELMLTIYASYAQEESRSASENTKWRIRKSFEKGELMNWRFMFGYTIRKGHIEVNPSEAAIVQEIMQRIIAYEPLASICRDLNSRNSTSTLGGRWGTARLRALASNEKLLGNALLQKKFVNNHLQKRLLNNTGELPQYFVEGSHPAIVDEATFHQVQEVLAQIADKVKGRAKPHQSVFTAKIICGKCGSTFKRVTSNHTIGWNCRTFQERGAAVCKSKKIPETVLQALSADVLGTDGFDEAAFSERIARIEVPADNVLRFIFTDEHTVERTWADRSRRESWTEDMKRAVSAQVKQRWGEKHAESNDNPCHQE